MSGRRDTSYSALPFRLRVQINQPDATCSRDKATVGYIVKLHGKVIGFGGTAAAAWRDAWSNMRLTPKQRVLKKYPGAWLWLQPQELYQVMPRRACSVDHSLGCAETPREAWADAARHL